MIDKIKVTKNKNKTKNQQQTNKQKHQKNPHIYSENLDQMMREKEVNCASKFLKNKQFV